MALVSISVRTESPAIEAYARPGAHPCIQVQIGETSVFVTVAEFHRLVDVGNRAALELQARQELSEV